LREVPVAALAGTSILLILSAWLSSYATPEKILPPRLELRPEQVTAGQGAYTVRIPELPESDVVVTYKFNEGSPTSFTLRLDRKGEASLEVGPDTPRGAYRFQAFRPAEAAAGYEADATVVVK